MLLVVGLSELKMKCNNMYIVLLQIASYVYVVGLLLYLVCVSLVYFE